ncbi:CD225/dispanin family protein [Myroides injenensis]|uniref:CD225/dispanin family protein n=1 Tax=Myroides injenensis TaxID=1183151 RepID=UPI00028948C3|nr:CD225/dispanin family protein [Myroides injenensis]
MDFREFEKVEEFREKPNNYLALSIISTILGLCSCIGFLIGIVAIVFSASVNSKYNAGDYEGAVKAAKTAKIISLVVLGIFVLHVLYGIYQIQAMGGWDMYIQSIRDAYQQGLDAGRN